MLVNMKELIDQAKAGGYGIAAACPMGIDQILWCFETAEKNHSPLILCNRSNLTHLSLETVGTVVKYLSEKFPSVPVALCLDHGNTYEDAARAIKAGYTGVMVDKSMYPDDVNIAALKSVVKMAHAADVAVEAALGGTPWRDPTPEEILAHLTKVDAFTHFIEETGTDCVAVFVGGSHGDHKTGEATLHYDLIEALRDASPAALVFHGSSFAGDENLGRAARSGISKFNVAGDLFAGGAKTAVAYCGTDGDRIEDCDLAMKAGYQKRLTEYMTFLGSVNKA